MSARQCHYIDEAGLDLKVILLSQSPKRRALEVNGISITILIYIKNTAENKTERGNRFVLCLVRVFTAVIKHHDQELGEGRVFFSLQFVGHPPGTLGRSLEAEL